MTSSLRLFTAFDVPAEVRAEVAHAVQPLRELLPEARWTKPENQHVTVRFIGSVPEDRLDDLLDACRRAASSSGAGRIAVTGAGAFPRLSRARVLWAGIDDPSGTAASLAQRLDEQLVRAGFGERAEAGFVPHLTLARLRRVMNVTEAIGTFALEPQPFPLDRLVLYRSYLSSQGSRYEPIEGWQLG